jgi:glycosyltransferase involved in cell wall biosynthesis
MKPFFSIIIPLYNKEHYILNALNSVVNQNFTDFEVIIIDDGSTDNSLDIVSNIEDNRIRIFKQENRGAAFTRNRGIEKSKGEYIALIDADDYWYPNHLSELKKLIKTFPNEGLYCNNYEISYSNNFTHKAIFNFEYKKHCVIIDDYFKYSIINCIAWTSSVCFTKEKFNALNGFNTNLEIAEDLDLWNRFALKYRVCFNPKITMTYTFFAENSLSKIENSKTRYNFINSYKNKENNNPSLKLYLDINRYAVALRCKLNNEHQLYKKLKEEINFKNLNFKQKLLINSPKYFLIKIKAFQNFLKRNQIYLSAHK